MATAFAIAGGRFLLRRGAAALAKRIADPGFADRVAGLAGRIAQWAVARIGNADDDPVPLEAAAELARMSVSINAALEMFGGDVELPEDTASWAAMKQRAARTTWLNAINGVQVGSRKLLTDMANTATREDAIAAAATRAEGHSRLLEDLGVNASAQTLPTLSAATQSKNASQQAEFNSELITFFRALRGIPRLAQENQTDTYTEGLPMRAVAGGAVFGGTTPATDAIQYNQADGVAFGSQPGSTGRADYVAAEQRAYNLVARNSGRPNQLTGIISGNIEMTQTIDHVSLGASVYRMQRHENVFVGSLDVTETTASGATDTATFKGPFLVKYPDPYDTTRSGVTTSKRTIAGNFEVYQGMWPAPATAIDDAPFVGPTAPPSLNAIVIACSVPGVKDSEISSYLRSSGSRRFNVEAVIPVVARVRSIRPGVKTLNQIPGDGCMYQFGARWATSLETPASTGMFFVAVLDPNNRWVDGSADIWRVDGVNAPAFIGPPTFWMTPAVESGQNTGMATWKIENSADMVTDDEVTLEQKLTPGATGAISAMMWDKSSGLYRWKEVSIPALTAIDRGLTIIGSAVGSTGAATAPLGIGDFGAWLRSIAPKEDNWTQFVAAYASATSTSLESDVVEFGASSEAHGFASKSLLVDNLERFVLENKGWLVLAAGRQ